MRERSLLGPAATSRLRTHYAASHFRKSRLLRVKSIKNVQAPGASDLTIATAATARCWSNRPARRIKGLLLTTIPVLSLQGQTDEHRSLLRRHGICEFGRDHGARVRSHSRPRRRHQGVRRARSIPARPSRFQSRLGRRKSDRAGTGSAADTGISTPQQPRSMPPSRSIRPAPERCIAAASCAC